MSAVEELCRLICEAEGVDPDDSGIGLGTLMPIGRSYKLWEARRRVAQRLIDAGWSRSAFDRAAYQREYMRKRRAAQRDKAKVKP